MQNAEMAMDRPAKALGERSLNADEKRVRSDTTYEGKENGGREGPVLGLGLRIGEESATNGLGNDSGLKTGGQQRVDENGVKTTLIPVPTGSPELGASDPMALLFESQVDLREKYADGVAETGRDIADTDVDRAATSVSASVSTPQRTTVQIADYTEPTEVRESDTRGGLNTSMSRRRENSTSTPHDTKHQHDKDKDSVPKLSAAKIQELASSPESLCLRPDRGQRHRDRSRSIALPASGPPLFLLPEDDTVDDADMGGNGGKGIMGGAGGAGMGRSRASGNGSPQKRRKSGVGKDLRLDEPPEFLNNLTPSGRKRQSKPRTVSTPGPSNTEHSTPVTSERQVHTWSSRSKNDRRNASSRLPLETIMGGQTPSAETPNPPSPIPISIPIPPFSIPTYLQLELSSKRPSPLYIHRSTSNDFPYESSRVKLERLLNFLLVPLVLEQVLCFGTLACLDNWLHSFTILPLRFGKSIFILVKSWLVNLGVEARELWSFVVKGVGRVWRRRRTKSSSTGKRSVKSTPLAAATPPMNGNSIDHDRDANDWREPGRRRNHSTARHRRTRSIPSALMPDDKADILKGLLMISTCLILMRFDASRVYHWIRGQAAIKLYVIYNVLEVGDRLFSAIGQDVLECLFSREALERKPDGRSKVLRPFWLFILALIYTVIHATALFYQVMTLNVAVNSYSNALMTLLLSNQFVEIKSTVFKKFEKDNLFQLTCADVVERFQLWLMLLIIASRNFVETGGFNFGNPLTMLASTTPSPITNSTPPAGPPLTTASIIPQSFLYFPSSVLSSLSRANSFLPTLGHMLSPFLMVLGSEMLVDWLKHAYINKFNNYRPAMYGRFFDILAKDYYTNAFAEQNLNRRLGLPIIPLSCLFVRVSIQTYQMFLTAWLPPVPSSLSPSNTTSLSSIHSHYSAFSSPSPAPGSSIFTQYLPSPVPTSLSQISALFQSLMTHVMPSPAAFVPIFTVILILLLYVTLLLAKLVLGMFLLSCARARYKSMKEREREVYNTSSLKSGSNSNPNSSNTINGSASLPKQPSTAPIPQSRPVPTNTATKNVSIDEFTVEGSKRVGGWGSVEVGDERRAWIYADDPDGLRALRERDSRAKSGGKGGKEGLAGIEGVRRYEMVAKRIW